MSSSRKAKEGSTKETQPQLNRTGSQKKLTANSVSSGGEGTELVGLLFHKSSRGKYIERMCILEDGILAVNKAKQGRQVARMSLSVSVHVRDHACKQASLRAFVIEDSSGLQRPIILAASTQATKDRWVEHIRIQAFGSSESARTEFLTKDFGLNTMKNFGEEGHVLTQISSAIRTHLDQVTEPEGILREDGLASKLIHDYLKFLEAREPYLLLILHPYIEEINNNTSLYLVRMKSGKGDFPPATVQNLVRLCTRLFYVVFSSADRMPYPTRNLFKTIRRFVRVKFPEQSLRAVGAVLFFRWLIPCLAGPEHYGYAVNISLDARSSLVFIGKLLAKMSGGTEYDVNDREAQPFLPFNPFLKNHIKPCFQYLDYVSGERSVERPEVWLPMLESTPLHEAAALGDTAYESTRLLLTSKTIEINSRDKSGYTPLHNAALAQAPRTCTLLLSRQDIDVRVPSSSNNTVLHYAVRQWPNEAGQEEVLDLLALRGVNVNSPNTLGETPLHQACQRGTERTVRWLLEHGASPMALAGRSRAKGSEQLPANPSLSPLHCALRAEKLDTARLLLERGALFDEPSDPELGTPREFAAQIAKELVEWWDSRPADTPAWQPPTPAAPLGEEESDSDMDDVRLRISPKTSVESTVRYSTEQLDSPTDKE